MKKLFFFLLILLGVGGAAYDRLAIPTASGQEDPPAFVQQPVTYVTGIIGDGSNTQGGTPAAFAYEPEDIPTDFGEYDLEDWLETTESFPHEGTEAKFRTHCNLSHVAYEDPITAPGNPDFMHLHMFFGNTGTNKDSTYQTLRTTGGSTCAGGILNRSAYWFPAVIKDNALGDKPGVVKPEYMIVYYNIGTHDASPKMTRIPRGLSYVFGFDPFDPDDDRHQDEIPGDHVYGGQGFNGWKCQGTNGSLDPDAHPVSPGNANQPYLRNDDGTPTLVCPENELIGAEFNGPPCWDGVNLTSPGGRGHMRALVRNIGSGQSVCPDGWYEVPSFQLNIWFQHGGPDDYKEWYFSCDRMPDFTQFHNGQCGHTDWLGAWDYGTEENPGIMLTWMNKCNGITIGSLIGDPHECDDTQYGDGKKGIVQGPAPDGSRLHQIDFGQDWIHKGYNRFFPLPHSLVGPFNLHTHGTE